MSDRRSHRLLKRLLDADARTAIAPAALRGSALGPAMFELLCALANCLIVQPGAEGGSQWVDITGEPVHDHLDFMTNDHALD